MSRKIAQTLPGGQSEGFAYDLDGNQVVATNFNGASFDSHGNVRFLMDTNGEITDTYTYDAFRNLTGTSGSTPNSYLYCGQWYDPHMQVYHLRNRLMAPGIGRFMTMDTYDGNNEDPVSLHKYLYAQDEPADKIDPTGHMTADELKEDILSGGEQAMEGVEDALGTIADGGENAEALSGGLASFGVALIPDMMLNKVLDKAAIAAKRLEIQALHPKARQGDLSPRGLLAKAADKDNVLQYVFYNDQSDPKYKTGFAPLELSLSKDQGYAFVPFYNGVTNQYQYDSLNRLTNLTWNLNAATLAKFAYQLGSTGNRTNLNDWLTPTDYSSMLTTPFQNPPKCLYAGR